jgi:hypothetical protein
MSVILHHSFSSSNLSHNIDKGNSGSLATAAAVAAAWWQWQWRQLSGNTVAEAAVLWRWQCSSGGSLVAAAWQHGDAGGSTVAAVAAAVLRSGSMAA